MKDELIRCGHCGRNNFWELKYCSWCLMKLMPKRSRWWDAMAIIAVLSMVAVAVRLS